MTTESYVPLTEAEATHLAQSFIDQLEVRHRHMLVEASMALGKPAPRRYEPPPTWVLAAVRVVFIGEAKLPAPPQLTAKDFFRLLGSIIGMSKQWEAVLTAPLPEEQELEKRFPVMTDARLRIRGLTAGAFRTTKKLARTLDRLSLRPEWRRAFYRGLDEGAGEIVGPDDTLNIESKIRTDICYFIWIYWPQVRLLGSARELHDFLRSFRQDDVSEKNLERVCREIGYRAKGRGRPKNLFCARVK